MTQEEFEAWQRRDFNNRNDGYGIGYAGDEDLGTGFLMDNDVGSVRNIVGNPKMKVPTVANTFSGNKASAPSAWSISDFIKDPFGSNVDYRAEFAKIMPNGSEKQYTDWLKTKTLEKQLNPGFDWGGALNIGLSAFDTFNKYQGQEKMFDYYDDMIQMKKDQVARSNAVKDSYGSAFSNAK